MAMVARQRGIQVVQAVAEALPFMDETFDFALMVTTSDIIAFEIHVLRPVIC
jgi:ubiquinone/menaquinone biosynthesis C-methylase UbiE